jgi:hypothetical protein
MINVRPLLYHIGRRGATLAFLAEVDVLQYQTLRSSLPFGLTAAQVYAPMVHLAPLRAWAGVWLMAGLACAVAVLWIPFRPYAFFIAAGTKTAWGLAYLDGWHNGTQPRGLMGAAVWLTFAGLVLVDSGWRENRR